MRTTISIPTSDSDTSSDAVAVQIELLRRMSPQDRLRRTLAWSVQLRRMAFAAIRRRHPEYSADEVRCTWIKLTYGGELGNSLSYDPKGTYSVNNQDDLLTALVPISELLTRLGIHHYVGGSVASSFHGATRSTMDVDVVAEIVEAHGASLISGIGQDYYHSASAIQSAIRRQSCFNLIHLPTSFKVDVFVSRQRPFDLTARQRAPREQLSDHDPFRIPVATAEDSIISKLDWYRQTNENSERQWDDVTRLIKLLGEDADRDYLKSAAESVGVADLLARLLKENSGESS